MTRQWGWTLLVLAGLLRSNASGEDSCPSGANIVSVTTRPTRLYLCQEARIVKVYSVALGRGGVGKRSYRDRKTPLGRYPLGSPRPSERFHVFVPIGYPTEDQRKHGYTGQDVGIHGPTRRFKWAGRLNTLFGWSEGCVAVGSDPEIDEIALWIRRNKVKEIIIR